MEELETRARRKIEDMEKKYKYQTEKSELRHSKALNELREELETEKMEGVEKARRGTDLSSR